MSEVVRSRPRAGRPPGADRARIVTLLWAAGVGAAALAQPVRALASAESTDFVAFLTGARLLRTDPSCLYCAGAQTAAQTTVLGHAPAAGLDQFVNPPLAAWVVEPLTTVPLRTALAIFLAISVAALVAAVVLVARMLPAAWGAERRAVVAVCTTILVEAGSALAYGQWDALLLLAGVVAVGRLRRGDSAVAGALLAAFAVKPQMLWLVVPALLVAGCRRTLAGLAAGAAVWAASGLALIGASGFRAWITDHMAANVGETAKTAGLPGLWAAATGRGSGAFALALVLAAAAIAGMWRRRRWLREEPAVAAALGVVLSMVCAPHVFDGDLSLVALLLVAIAPRRPPIALAAAILTGAAALLDSALGAVVGHAEVIVLCGLLGVLWLDRDAELTSRERREAPPGASRPRRDRASHVPDLR